MGTFIYSVRARNITVDSLDAPIHALVYLTKPNYAYDSGADKRLTASAESYWYRRACKGQTGAAKYVARTGDVGFEDGDPVYQWKGDAWDYDTPDFKNIEARKGWLFKVKGKWTVQKASIQVCMGSWGPGKKCFNIDQRSPLFYKEAQLEVWLAEYGAMWPDKLVQRSVLDESQSYGVRTTETPE